MHSVSIANSKLVFILFLLFVFTGTHCKKKPAATPEEQLIEKRKEDAAYNNSITPGIGNVFFEEKLIPNSPNQLISKIAYNGDTLATYGKINGAGQLQYITATVLAKKGKSELLVTELFPDVSKSRMYTIINGKKSSMVIELNHISKTKQTLYILDYDWSKDESVVLKQTFFENGKAVANYSAFKALQEDDNRVYNCNDPQPSDDLDKSVDNHLDYFQCGGLAWDTHPTLIVIKTTLLGMVQTLKNAGQLSSEKLNELNSIELDYSILNDLFKKIKDKISGYKFENSRLSGLLKEISELISELKSQQKVDIQLVPFVSGTDLEYDETTDAFVKQTFTVQEKSTGLPYTKRPVFVDMVYIDPVTNSVLHSETNSSFLNNGLVIFNFDPLLIPNYLNYSSLLARYSFTGNDGNPSITRTATLKFIKPKVVFKSGAELPSPVSFFNYTSQNFKLVNNDNSELKNIDYNNVSFDNITNNKVGVTMLKGSTDFSLSLNTPEAGVQTTSFDIYYKNRKIQSINASLNDSTEYYKNLVLGVWTNSWYGGPNFNEFYEEDKIEVKPNGVAIWFEARYASGAVTTGLSTNVGWTITKTNGMYIMQIGAQYGRITPTELQFSIMSSYYKNVLTKL